MQEFVIIAKLMPGLKIVALIEHHRAELLAFDNCIECSCKTSYGDENDSWSREINFLLKLQSDFVAGKYLPL